MQSLGVRADFLVLLEVKYKVKPRCQSWIKVRQRQLLYAISSLRTFSQGTEVSQRIGSVYINVQC